MTGCVGDLVELTPKQDAGSMSQPDLAQAVATDGGSTMPKFDPDVQLDIHNLGCAAANCHAPGSPQTMILKDPAADPASIAANLSAFTSQANMGANSPVLTKNLATSGATHGGGKPFQTANDPIYVRWLAWITAGNSP